MIQLKTYLKVENQAEDKFSELESLFEEDKPESEPVLESEVSDTPVTDSATNEEIENSWNQLENIMDSAKEEIETIDIIDTAVPEKNSNQENKELLDLQIEESPMPNSESSSNLYEDEAGFIIEEFKDEDSFDLDDDDENTQIMDLSNIDVNDENPASEVSDGEGIDDIDIIEEDDPFIPEEKNESQVLEPDVFEIENVETSGLEIEVIETNNEENVLNTRAGNLTSQMNYI